jgi:Protochlamydia outer membrane protein
MKKQVFLFLACLSLIAPSLIADCCAPCCMDNCFGFDSVLTFDVGGGYRNDSLKFKIFPSEHPGSLIEQNWKNMGMGVVETDAQLLICENYLLKGDFDYGWFTNNGSHRFDFFQVFGAHAFKAKPRGNVCDISGGIGYQFNFNCARVSLAPLVGYSYHQQRLKSRKFSFIISPEFGHLLAHNDYKFRWSGPWVGFALAYQATCEIWLYLDYYYHWTRFRGTIKEHFAFQTHHFPSHLRSNRANGNEVTVGGIYTFCDYWYIGIKFDYKQFCSNKGKGKANIERHHFDSPLRNLRWNSSTITMDIGYEF